MRDDLLGEFACNYFYDGCDVVFANSAEALAEFLQDRRINAEDVTRLVGKLTEIAVMPVEARRQAWWALGADMCREDLSVEGLPALLRVAAKQIEDESKVR